MGEIRISIPSENLGFPYSVCKKLTYMYKIRKEVLVKVYKWESFGASYYYK